MRTDFIPGRAPWVKRSSVAVSCGVGHRHGSNPVLLWLWHRLLVTTALIRPLAWETPYAVGVTLEKTKKKKRNISFQIKVLQKEEHIWSGIQASEAHCKHLVPTEHLAVSSSISLVRRDAYVGKKRRADFLADHHWVWCFFTE